VCCKKGTKNEIETAVHGIINDFGRKGFILGTDCTIPNDTDMERLKTAINAARA
jgi:uroporphyrinogen decarboxylase